MAEFNTSQAQNRWNNLAKGDQATLEKIMRGQGNMQDFRKIQSLIGRYDRLASSIFNQAVTALEAAAKTRVDTVAEKRAGRGKPLTDARISELLDIANKKAWDDAGPELVVIVEESMASQLEKQDARLDSIFAQRLRESIPDQDELEKQLDQIQDQGAADEEEKRWNTRVAELKDWMQQQLTRFDGLEERVEQRAGFAVRQALNNWKLHNAEPGTGSADSLQQRTDEDTATAFVAPSDSSPVVGSAVNSYTDEQLGRIGDSLENIAEQGSDEDEQKKANTWWRSFKSTVGNFGSRTKDALKALTGGGLIGTLAKIVGTVLAAELLGGKVFEKIGEFLSSGKLQEWGGQFLKFVTDNAKKLTDWIVGQFKSAKEQRDINAGVNEGDSEDLVEAKRQLLVKKSQLEHGSEYWGTTPEDHDRLVQEAKDDIKKQEEKVAALEKQQADEKGAASGKVGAAPDAGSTSGGGGSGGIPGPSSNAGSPPGSTSSPITSSDGGVADANTATSAGPLASKGADQSFIPGLGTGAADTRMSDPATSMTTINNSPTLNLGDSITSPAANSQTATLPGSAPQVNGSATQVNLSNFRRTPGDDTLTLMNMGMYTN